MVDGRVATATGISASMPMSLTLIEAIAGSGKAHAVGREIGLPDWDACAARAMNSRSRGRLR